MGKVTEGSGSINEKAKKGIAKIFDGFFKSDAKSIGDYIVEEVLDPAVRDIASKAIKGSTDMWLYGKDMEKKSSSNVRRVNYSGRFDEDEPVKEFKRRPTFTSITLPSKSDCEAVLSQARNYLKKYPVVTVADIFEWADIHTDNYMANEFGWAKVDQFEIVPVQNGWEIRMPRPHALD